MEFLDRLPLWAIYIGTVALALLATEIGFRFGLWLRKRFPSMEETHLSSSLIGGMLGLLAFLLAITIAAVIGHHTERKAMVVTEANAIGTAYLRAGFLEEPDLSTSRDLLREYVEVRLTPATDPSMAESTLVRSEEIHYELWSIVEDTVK